MPWRWKKGMGIPCGRAGAGIHQGGEAAEHSGPPLMHIHISYDLTGRLVDQHLHTYSHIMLPCRPTCGATPSLTSR